MGNTTVQAPAPVNPAQVGADTLRTQLELAPQVFAANAQYLPQYATLANQVASQMLPNLLSQQATANTSQRTSDIADVRALGGQALEAWRAANPELGQTMGALSQRIASSAGRTAPQIGNYQATAGNLENPATVNAATTARGGLFRQLEGDAGAALGQVTPMQIELQRQAMEQLGADLSPAQIAKVQQDTRAAYAARGLYDSNRAIGAEILNTDAARSQRRAAAQQFALSVDQVGQQQIAANRAYAGNVAGMGVQQDQFNAGQTQQAGLANADAANRFGLTRYTTNAGLSQFNAGMSADRDRANAQFGLGADQQAISNYFNLANQYAATAQDPYQLVLGRSGAPAAAQGLAQTAGPTMFNPFDPSVTQIYAANQANEMAARTATANNRAGVAAGGLGALGSLGGAGIMALALCWVARAAYGVENPRWLQFRDFVLRTAPAWFFELYRTHGPTAAARVAADPALRLRVRSLMDNILNAELCHG